MVKKKIRRRWVVRKKWTKGNNCGRKIKERKRRKIKI